MTVIRTGEVQNILGSISDCRNTCTNMFFLFQESLAKTESIHLNKKLELGTCLETFSTVADLVDSLFGSFMFSNFTSFFAGRLKTHRFKHRFQTRSSTTCSVQKKPHGKPDVQCIAHCSNGFLWFF